jgi:3-oxoacyl-ACP reductase-like protein
MALAVNSGCKKSQSTAPTPTPENATATPTPAATANPGATPNQAAAQTPATPPVDTTKAFADVNSALKARDYQKATDTLLAVQRMPHLTEQQSLAAHGQMVELQKAVAAGLASGDPNAKAAADRLRAQASGN